jgi:hypothetical protein
MWRAIIQPSSSSPFAPGSNKIPVMAASRAVSDITQAIAAGRWMPQRSAAERKTVSTASSSRKSSQLFFA